MAHLWLSRIRYVFLCFFLKATACLAVPPDETTCDFCVTRFTTYNMVTTIYWKSNFSQNSSIQYVLKYQCNPPPWTSVPCPRPQWHRNSSEMSCVILTCATTPNDDGNCEMKVEARENSTTFVTSSVLHNPYINNVPSQITDIDITRSSSSSAIIRWNRPAAFCAKYKYCMEFKYHREGAIVSKSVTVPSSQDNNSTVITGLASCPLQKYSFYLNVYQDLLCTFLFVPLWTTGPFILPSQNAVVPHSLHLRVLNYNATIYWRQSEFCRLIPKQFTVHYKSDMSSQNWSISDCLVKNESADLFSCHFLTCKLFKEGMYEVQIRVSGSRGRSENILSFHPSLENIPDQIRHATINAVSSTSVRVSWKLEPSFCSKFDYCLEFYYHADSENKTVEVTKDKQDKHSVIVHNLLPYTKYYFYASTFGSALGCLYHYTHGSTGPFTGTTLEDVPSRSPVVICGLCDLRVHGRLRDGIVRWQLPPKEKWNGLPRVFVIQWREKSEKNYSQTVNYSQATWKNKTITKALATQGNLTGLLVTVEYFVRVKMCNGDNLCSRFSKPMKIGMLQEDESETGSSQGRIAAITVGVVVLVLVAVVFGIIIFIKLRKHRLRLQEAANLDAHSPLPSLEPQSGYEDVATTRTPNYSRLSPTEDYDMEDTAFNVEHTGSKHCPTRMNLARKSENSSQVKEVIIDDVPRTETIIS